MRTAICFMNMTRFSSDVAAIGGATGSGSFGSEGVAASSVWREDSEATSEIFVDSSVTGAFIGKVDFEEVFLRGFLMVESADFLAVLLFFSGGAEKSFLISV